MHANKSNLIDVDPSSSETIDTKLLTRNYIDTKLYWHPQIKNPEKYIANCDVWLTENQHFYCVHTFYFTPTKLHLELHILRIELNAR